MLRTAVVADEKNKETNRSRKNTRSCVDGDLTSDFVLQSPGMVDVCRVGGMLSAQHEAMLVVGHGVFIVSDNAQTEFLNSHTLSHSQLNQQRPHDAL